MTREEADEEGVPQKVTRLEYQYEEEMEPVYMASHLKAFKKTVEEGLFKVRPSLRPCMHLHAPPLYCIHTQTWR